MKTMQGKENYKTINDILRKIRHCIGRRQEQDALKKKIQRTKVKELLKTKETIAGRDVSGN